MVFNSGVFILFFTGIFGLYWLVSNSSGRIAANRLLLIASYIFYGYWDWLYLVLILTSTVVDYTVARVIFSTNNQKKRQAFLALSVLTNLGLLATFKYYDFFIEQFVTMSQSVIPAAFPEGADSLFLNVALPVGISFYTFQTMSYTIDIYRKVTEPEKNFFDFALFVCFFPQLVAGPIERASDLIPQIKKERTINRELLARGFYLILLGFFMKVFVADSLSDLVNRVYLPSRDIYEAHPQLSEGHGQAQVFLATMAFAFQVYGDFAGYSFIALGTAMMLGFRLTINFLTPEFSQSPAELWRRWHVTLNRWVTDYIYIPLGGNRVSIPRFYFNLVLAFTLMGFWHGASLTFVLWGFLHGIWMAAHRLISTARPAREYSGWKHVLSISMKIMTTYSIFVILGVLFRAYDINHALVMYKNFFSGPSGLFESIMGVPAAGTYFMQILRIIAFLLFIDFMQWKSGDIFWIFKKPLYYRVIVYTAMLFCIGILGIWGQDVIYFAF